MLAKTLLKLRLCGNVACEVYKDPSKWNGMEGKMKLEGKFLMNEMKK